MKKDILSKLNLVTLVFLIMIGSVISSCKKEQVMSDICFANDPTVRQIQNQPAKVTAVGTQFYIVEAGTIDTRLNPCNLEQRFKVDNLLITITGDVKTTPQQGVCCTDNFVITKISKR